MRHLKHIRTPMDRSPMSASSQIVDRHGRNFNYLRLAVNEYCNLRCIYCMPEEGVPFRQKIQLLSTSEIKRLLSISAQIGVSKIRFTGGEPLLRKDIPELVDYAQNLSGVESVQLTTNGVLLDQYINDLEDSGLSGINISLDTLRSERFKAITRRDGLDRVLGNIQLAIKSKIPSVKINVVAMRNLNHDELLEFANLTLDHEITVRFIELMPFDSHQIWKTGKFYRAEHIVEELHSKIDQLRSVDGSSTEHYIFQMQKAKGKIAVIPAYSRNLCGACNRIRITADGKLLNCLYSQEETNLRDAMRKGESDKEIKTMIQRTFLNKHVDGWAAQQHNGAHRESMTQIGG